MGVENGNGNGSAIRWRDLGLLVTLGSTLMGIAFGLVKMRDTAVEDVRKYVDKQVVTDHRYYLSRDEFFTRFIQLERKVDRIIWLMEHKGRR
jgi:hypothetical protein